MNKYFDIFNSACEKYRNPEINSRGYELTLFSRLRHSFKYDDKLKKLSNEISRIDDDQLAKEYIQHYLSVAPRDNHSFACYFIDELIRLDSANASLWQSYDPKPIVYFSNQTSTPSYLYRGMRLDDVEALAIYKNGMECTMASLDALSSTHSFNLGLSTSKSFDVTFAYAAPHITNPAIERGLMVGEGWIFEIDAAKLSPSTMIDIMETNSVRREKEWERRAYGSWLLSAIGGFLAKHDQEVNIIQSIPPSAFCRLFRVERTSGTIVKVYANAQSLEDDVRKDILLARS